MNELVIAVGLVFIIEGLAYALAPAKLKAILARMEQVSDEALRMGGLAAVGLGVVIIWLARQAIA